MYERSQTINFNFLRFNGIRLSKKQIKNLFILVRFTSNLIFLKLIMFQMKLLLIRDVESTEKNWQETAQLLFQI